MNLKDEKHYYDKMLKEITDCNFDAEFAHMAADEILVQLIRDLGFNRLANYFDDLEKWYG